MPSSRRRADDKDGLVTVTESLGATGRAAAAPASHRETARRRRGLSLAIGLITRQGHPRRRTFPARLQGRPRPVCAPAAATGTGRGWRRTREALFAAGTDVLVVDNRARPFARVIEAVMKRIRRLSNYTPNHRRQHCHAEGARALVEAGRRRGQSRHRSGLDLTTRCRRRGRRAAASAILDVVEECRKSECR